ncbi:MAG TPA: hypothetical protein VGI88_13275 [Verrucomicrobiae bacterium]|jgi:23S rRNA maturation mini-RNase III
MKQKIEALQANIGSLMQQHLSKGDFETVTILSPLLSRIQDLQRRNASVEYEVSEIEAALKSLKAKPVSQKITEAVPQLTEDFNNAAERGRPQTLKITIDWKANKRNRASEQICENTAAASQALFISRLIEELGSDAVQKLEKIRINRGPLLSKTPAKDFVNQTQGRLYGHKKIRGTDYYILTHSQTSQKVEDLNRVCRVVGLSPGSVQIEQVNRYTWLDGLN